MAVFTIKKFTAFVKDVSQNKIVFFDDDNEKTTIEDKFIDFSNFKINDYVFIEIKSSEPTNDFTIKTNEISYTSIIYLVKTEGIFLKKYTDEITLLDKIFYMDARGFVVSDNWKILTADTFSRGEAVMITIKRFK